MSTVATRPPVGALLREWRQRRRLSQFELALESGVSSRLAAGYAPAYAQHALDARELGPVRDAIEQVLRAHEPYPALVIDRHWGLVSSNRPVGALIEGVAAHLLEPPVNVLRLSLHPEGLAPRIANLHKWREHLLDRLARDAAATGDPALSALHEELAAYPAGEPVAELDPAFADIAVPLRLRHGDGELAFLSTKTTFGTAVDVTVAELSVESFFPADKATAEAMQALLV